MSDASAIEMVEREEPRFVKFKVGDVVEGILTEIRRLCVQGKPALRYTVDDNGQLYSFLGTYQINEKLRVADIGKRIRVRYEGEGAPANRGGNRMRVFRVFNNCTPCSRYVHRLVVEAFIGEIPAGQEVNHISGQKVDNRIENLEVVTHSQNTAHAWDTGLRSRITLKLAA